MHVHSTKLIVAGEEACRTACCSSCLQPFLHIDYSPAAHILPFWFILSAFLTHSHHFCYSPVLPPQEPCLILLPPLFICYSVPPIPFCCHIWAWREIRHYLPLQHSAVISCRYASVLPAILTCCCDTLLLLPF